MWYEILYNCLVLVFFHLFVCFVLFFLVFNFIIVGFFCKFVYSFCSFFFSSTFLCPERLTHTCQWQAYTFIYCTCKLFNLSLPLNAHHEPRSRPQNQERYKSFRLRSVTAHTCNRSPAALFLYSLQIHLKMKTANFERKVLVSVCCIM